MKKINERDILERQLLQAKKDLFRVGTLRELKVIQNRIHFLNEKIEEFDKKNYKNLKNWKSKSEA